MSKMHSIRHKGQGIVEYSGALIVAAVVVAGVLLAGESGLGQVYLSVIQYVHDDLMNETPT